MQKIFWPHTNDTNCLGNVVCLLKRRRFKSIITLQSILFLWAKNTIFRTRATLATNALQNILIDVRTTSGKFSSHLSLNAIADL